MTAMITNIRTGRGTVKITAIFPAAGRETAKRHGNRLPDLRYHRHALPLCLYCFSALYHFGCGAIILSFLSRKGEPFTGLAIAGLVLGILSLILGVAEGLYMIAINFMLRDPQMSSMFDQILDQYQNMQ